MQSDQLAALEEKDQLVRSIVPFKGADSQHDQEVEEEDELEFDLEEEVEKEGEKFYAIALYYSEQSFSRQELFRNMIAIWGLKQLAPVHDVDDKVYLIEFASEGD